MDTRAKQPHVYVCTDTGGEHPHTVRVLLEQAGYPAHVVSLLTAAQYRRWRNGGIVQRVWFRLLSKLFGPLSICLRSLFWPKGSVIIANTNLLFAPLGLSWLAKVRGHRMIYLLYDLYPDAFEVLAGQHGPTLLCRVLAAITRQTLRSADATVFLGDFLQVHAEHRYGRARLGAVIDVAAPDPELVVAARQPRAGRPFPPLRLRYGGQLGHMHCPPLTATAVASAVERFGKTVHFDFFASGPGVVEATPILRRAGIEIVPLAQEVNWKASLRTYDFALVALSPGGATVCFPSKTYGMLAAGLPLIAICPHWSDLAHVIREHGVGFVVSNSPFDAVIDERGVRRGLADGPALDVRAADYLEQVLRLRPQAEVDADFNALIARLLEEPAQVKQAHESAIEAAATAISQPAMRKRWSDVVEQVLAKRD